MTNRPPLTRADLDAALPASPECEHVSGVGLQASCHREAGLALWYSKGVLVLRCGACHALVTVIAVADPPVVQLQ